MTLVKKNDLSQKKMTLVKKKWIPIVKKNGFIYLVKKNGFSQKKNVFLVKKN